MNIKRSITTKLTLLILSTVFFSSCVSYQMMMEDKPSESKLPTKDIQTKELSKRQSLVVQAALDACNKSYTEKLNFDNKSFTNDCSGLIYGIYWSAGIDLISAISSESGNGVKRIHSLLDKKNLIHKKKIPEPGDLIFWSNTYGTWGGNPLSHIGIVVSVDKRGNIEYVHNNTYLGQIKKESMNLYRPKELAPINNYMRYDSKYKKTSGELFDSFGALWKL